MRVDRFISFQKKWRNIIDMASEKNIDEGKILVSADTLKKMRPAFF